MTAAPRRSAPDAPSVAVEPGAHSIPGGAATLRVHARNLAAEPRDLRVSVIGLEEAWRPVPIVAPAVAPDQTVTAELAITPSAGAATGSYAMLVLVESIPAGVADTAGTGGAMGTASRTVADASVRIDGASDVVLAVEPADVRGVRRRRVEVVVGNTGLADAAVTLATTSDPALSVRLSAERVHLRPAETIRVPTTLHGRVRVAGGRLRHGYEVVATGSAAPQRVHGSFTSRAILGASALRIAAVAAVVALWIAAVVVAMPRLAEQFAPDDPSQSPTPTVADGPGGTGGTGGPGGGGTDGGGGVDGEGGDGEGGDDGSATPEGVRVSGVVSGADPGGVVIEVVPTSSLWASALDADTAARPSIAPGKVAAAAMPIERQNVAQRLTTSTNENGVWALSGLSLAGRYLVTLSKPGFGTQRLVMTGAQLSAQPLETALEAGQGSMSGIVRGPAGPVGGVEMTLTDGTTTVTTRTATTGAVGRWHVDGLVTPSTYLVTASAPDLGAESTLVDLAAAGSREVQLTLDAGVAAISGRVIGPDSLGGTGGLGGITVTATDGTTTRTATTVTGSGAGAGRFLLSGLPVPGRYTVTISGTGYSTVTRAVNLTAAGVSGWEISLTPSGGTVTGTVTDDAGAGIAAAGLTLTNGSDATAVYKTMSASDGSGTFRFTGVQPGTYVLSAEAFGHEPTYAEVVVRAGGSIDIALVLQRIPGDGLVATASIVGRAFDASTRGQITCPILAPGQECLVTATVTMEDLDGSTRVITSRAEPDEQYRLPASGSDEEGLLPGRYTVTITAPGYEPGEVNVTVPMGAEAEAAPVALVPSPSLIGTVLARTGVLPPGLCVIARSVTDPGTVANPCDPEEPECATATSRCVELTDGTYRMDRLSAGQYRVTVVDPSCTPTSPPCIAGGYVPPQPQEVNLLPGEIRRYDVIVERNGILSVTALLSDGAGSVSPAQGTWVRADLDGATIAQEQVDDNGFVQLLNLRPGTYTIIGSSSQDGEEISSATVTIGLNQEISIQLVLASPVDQVLARVGYQMSASTDTPVVGAQIAITGVIGYTGTVPRHGSGVFTTDSLGTVWICTVPTPECAGSVLPLVENVVDVRITALGFEPYTANGVTLDSLASILLTPATQTLEGTVNLIPAGTFASVRFEVLEAPPGVVDARLGIDDAGNVTFTDPARPGGNQIRPGWYTIVASRDGYAEDPLEFQVPLRTTDVGTIVPVVWELRQHARVGVAAIDDVTLERVPGAVMTLRGPNELVIERTAGPTQQVVDFGTLPAGPYTIDVNIPGFEPVDEADIVIAPGAVLASPTLVPMQRLGTITGDVVSVFGPDWYQSLPGATVTAREAGEEPLYTVTSGASGRYRITGTLAEPGLAGDVDWQLNATAPGHVAIPTTDPEPNSEAIARSQNGVVTEAQDLGLAPARASLVVVVQDGDDTVPGLNVQLVYSDLNRVPALEPCAAGTEGCLTADGSYHFRNLLPLTYTLFVSGGGYMPLSTPVTVAPGSSPTLLVPIAAPGGSIQGQVLQALPGGATSPVDGTGEPALVRVALLGSDPAVAVAIAADGGYLLENLGAGTYAVGVQKREDADADWVTVVSRNVSVLAGQSAIVDLVIPLVSRTVRVDVTSANGTDLAGGLVTLHGTAGGADLTLGPQPLGRTADRFTTSFSQVPEGTWQAIVSGPVGHHGSYLSDEVDVDAASPATVPIPITIAETELRLQVAPITDPREPPGQVTVTATPDDVGDDVEVDAVQAALIIGASDTVLYLPDVAWDLAVALPASSDWDAAISPDVVAAGTVRVLAQVTLTPPPVATTTGVALDPDEADVGASIEVTVTVAAATAGEPAPTGGEVSLRYRTGTTGAWTSGGTADLSDGEASFALDTTGWAPGSYTVEAAFEAASGWEDSDDDAQLELNAPDAGQGADADQQPEPGEGG